VLVDAIITLFVHLLIEIARIDPNDHILDQCGVSLGNVLSDPLYSKLKFFKLENRSLVI
jgi:hypothetical protein